MDLMTAARWISVPPPPKAAAWLVCGVSRRKRFSGFDDEERSLLLEAAAGIPELQAVLLRAEPRADLGMWLLRASASELDDLYSLEEEFMDTTRSRKRLDLLEGLLATLCTPIDGF
jgi:hypothetical protein